MSDIFSSLFNNYKSKVTNPFFGTLIIVWITRNWIVVYSFFMFDEDCKMQDKINYINDYFGKKIFLYELKISLGLTFLVLISSFILLAIGRLLSDVYYKIFEPWIVTKIDPNAVYTKADKIELEGRIERLNIKIESQTKEISNSEFDLSKLREKTAIKNDDFEKQIEVLGKQIEELGKEHKTFSDITESFKEVVDQFHSAIKTL